MTSLRVIIIFSVITVLASCKTNKDLTMEADPEMEFEILDTLFVTAPAEVEETKNNLDPYRASATRTHDLKHTKIAVSFDWSKQHVLGEAELTLSPLFYATDILTLDAKVFDIHSIKMNGKKLEYAYDDMQIDIQLDKVYTRDETFKVQINYTAKPNEGPSGGSQAITSDKGLFFINPDSNNKFKPQQIWTQGETENSSRWFPTIDKPNERCTQEVMVTVQDKFQTLSNGLLISSKKNADGTRTDYWKQDKPHAPYLFMLGIGEYAVVKGDWNGKELLYYVEKAYEKDAEAIFNHTPEMLTFFSDILDYPYPWDKYAQIVCRDYVSGAMENTGAVVFGDFVQKTTRELLDGNNDDIVAHEMFHHWFGDLVTCESWSNLTLNEGFASYSEFLWQEYKYGHEASERKRIHDLNGYIMTADRGGTHDLIDFGYDNKEDMFDGHSYNKGALIVHMLRNYVGDEAFFASLNRYLTQHQYTDVEAHELRMAFEDVVGEDLNWFFNQWFYDKGHPQLKVSYQVDPEVNNVYIDVEQTQDVEDNVAIFRIPFKSALYYASGKVEYYDLWLDQREQQFEIEIEGDELPVVVVLDGTHDILMTSSEKRTDAEYVNLFNLSEEYEDKYVALNKLKGKSIARDLVSDAAESKSVEMRLMALGSMIVERDATTLENLALNDSSSAVRKAALKKLKNPELAAKLVETDKSYTVIGAALEIINRQDPERGLELAKGIVKDYHKPLLSNLGDIFSKSKDAQYLGFFEQNINDVSMFSFFNYMAQYGKLAKVASPEQQVSTAKVLKNVAMEESNTYFKKYSATNLIQSMMDKLSANKDDNQSLEARNTLSTYMTQIVNGSSDERLRKAFDSYIDKP